MAIYKAVVRPDGKAVGHATPDALVKYLEYELDEKGNIKRDDLGRKLKRTEHITALNGDAGNFALSCREISSLFGSRQRYDDVKYKHYVQGFPPEDNALMTKEDCHALGVELAKTFWANYPVLIVSHYDQETETGEYHWHNHFVVYNCNVKDGRSLDTSRAAMLDQKFFVACQAEAHGLTRKGLVLQDGRIMASKASDRKTLGEIYTQKKGQEKLDRENRQKKAEEIRQRTFLTQKAELRLAIRTASAKTQSFEEFRVFLKKVYNVDTKLSRGAVSYLHPDRKTEDGGGWIRGRTLGPAYEKEALHYGAYQSRDRAAALGGDPAGALAGQNREGLSGDAASRNRLDEERKQKLQELYAELFGGAEADDGEAHDRDGSRNASPDGDKDRSAGSPEGSPRRGDKLL